MAGLTLAYESNRRQRAPAKWPKWQAVLYRMRFAVFALALSSCARPAPVQHPPAAAVVVPDVFPAVPEVRSAGGVARLKLDVIADPNSGEPTFVYQAQAGNAPTVRVRPGDLLALDVENDLPKAGRYAHDVNIHFHGLMVPPRAPQDEVILTAARPGRTLHYRVRIPQDHPPGLYWYHPHIHGESYYQVTNGMSGAIVVEGIQEHLPGLAGLPERILVLRDTPTGPGFVDPDLMDMPGMPPSAGRQARNAARVSRAAAGGVACRPETGLQPTVNRQPRARIGIRPGETQFFRVVNAAAARTFDLAIDDAQLDLVALDGVPLGAFPGGPVHRRVKHILLPPAARAEFTVTAPAHATVLRTNCVDAGPAGDANPAAVLADLDDPAKILAMPSAAAAAPATPAPALATFIPLARTALSSLPAPQRTRTIAFTEDERGFYIDGKAYVMGGPPAFVVRSGTLERWVVENRTDEIHDFHIHQVHFVVDAVNGVRNPDRSWVDTLNVPPQRRVGGHPPVPGRATIVLDFRDPAVRGDLLYHCHILDHEDQGMMAVLRVE